MLLENNLYILSPQQPNIKQKFVALLKRFKVSDEVRPLTSSFIPRSCVATRHQSYGVMIPTHLHMYQSPREKAAGEEHSTYGRENKGFP